MKFLFLCPYWGSEAADFDQFLRNVKTAGYDGVEVALSGIDLEKDAAMVDKINEQALVWVGQNVLASTKDFKKHKGIMLEQLSAIASKKPLFINCHTGKDYFSFEQNMELISEIASAAKKLNVHVVHETHRGRFSYAAHVTQNYLYANEELRIAADFSHWCNVAESLLEDQAEALDLAISRTDHIHARVGFAEGPQIPDPANAYWKKEVDIFLGWWDRIVDRAQEENKEYITLLSEFGPYPYMQIFPDSGKPVANQWEVNLYMKNLLKKRYS